MTDELDLLTNARPDDVPTVATVSRHRAQLLDAMARPSRFPSRRLAALAGAAAAVVAAVTVGAVALDPSRDDRREQVTVSGPEPTTTSAPVRMTCAADLAAEVEVPGATAGPVDGPAPGDGRPTMPGQRVVHWTTTGGTVELRHPAAPRPTYDLRPQTHEPGVAGTETMLSTNRFALGVGSDEADVVIDTSGMRALLAPPCNTADIEIVENGRVLRRGVDLGDLGSGVEVEALVTGREQIDAEPAGVHPCQAPRGVTAPPNRAGGHSGPPTRLPVEAFEVFLATAPEAAGFARTGYVELVEGDGSITYAKPFDGGPGYVVLVSVVETDAGWMVDGWRATGC